jgi:hypothetical protein
LRLFWLSFTPLPPRAPTRNPSPHTHTLSLPLTHGRWRRLWSRSGCAWAASKSLTPCTTTPNGPRAPATGVHAVVVQRGLLWLHRLHLLRDVVPLVRRNPRTHHLTHAHTPSHTITLTLSHTISLTHCRLPGVFLLYDRKNDVEYNLSVGLTIAGFVLAVPAWLVFTFLWLRKRFQGPPAVVRRICRWRARACVCVDGRCVCVWCRRWKPWS